MRSPSELPDARPRRASRRDPPLPRCGCLGRPNSSLNSQQRPLTPSTAARTSEETWYNKVVVHAALLGAVAAYLLVVSWRKWPDAIVDFGRELYLPWRMSEGAVLFRDVDNFYGPLSQWFNAGLFRVFGPGMMVLVAANLAIFAAIASVTYFLLRKAWGPLAGVMGVGALIVVFGFSRLSRTGSFNYLAPYAHEATHGILVLVVLVAVAARWVTSPSLRNSAALGLLAGLALVLKAEVILAALLVCAVALGLRFAAGEQVKRGWLVAFGVGLLLPTGAFIGYFSQHLPFVEACAAASRAWLNVIVARDYVAEPAQLKFAGLDQPGKNFLRHLSAVAIALSVAGALAVAGRTLAKMKTGWPMALAGGGLVVVVAGVSFGLPPFVWSNIGRCLLGLVLVYLLVMGWLIRREGVTAVVRNPTTALRVLLAVVGAAMMLRMILNGRIHQFGFYQAALAALVVIAVMVSEFPRRVCDSFAARRWLQAAMVALLLPGMALMATHSVKNYRRITFPLGEGRDRFYGWPGMRSLQRVEAYLRENGKGGTLVALPEGLMLNYLVRMRSPVGTIYSAVTDATREADLVKRLEAASPEWVAVVPRDLGEYGIARYGERSGAGMDLLRWVERDYVEAGSRLPTSVQPGVIYLFRRREVVEVAAK